MTKKLVCIACPRGCELTVSGYDDKNSEAIIVKGNRCPKGITYGKQETICPLRTLTTTVAIVPLGHFSSPLKRLPVKTEEEIPLAETSFIMHQLRNIAVSKQIHYGDTIATIQTQNGQPVSVIATASTEEAV